MKIAWFNRISFSVFFFLLCLALLSACKEKDPIVPPEVVKASATVNDSYYTFLASTFIVTEDAQDRLINTLTFARSNNSRIILRFPGTEEGTFTSLSDTSVVCSYVDPSERVYQSDTGTIVISTFMRRDGLFTVSGGFEFIGYFPNLIDPTNPMRVEVKNGGFVNITNN